METRNGTYANSTHALQFRGKHRMEYEFCATSLVRERLKLLSSALDGA
jgi:hypothetical protein